METKIYQFGTDRLFRDRAFKNPLILTEGLTFKIDEKVIHFGDCKTIDFSIYFYGKTFFIKEEGVGDLQKISYDPNLNLGERIVLEKKWVELETVKEGLIELDENPFPKSYKWLRWLFFIIVVIVIIAIIVGYWGNINSSFGSTVEKIGNTLRGADEYKVPAIVVGAGSIVEEVENTRDRDTVSVVAGFDYVFDTVPLTWFEPEFAIPKNVIGRVYVLYHKAQNSSWCYLDGADVPDNEYTITKMADGKGIIFKGTDGTTFDGKSFTVAFPADYDPDNNYMFYFADGAGE